MRTRGWQGSPPADDDEARERIIGAARRCVDRYGAKKTGLSDVAAELGVTRQTVYRLFPSTDELFLEVGRASVGGFMDRIAARVGTETDPAEALVELLAFTVEELPRERYLALLLTAGRQAAFARGATSSTAFELAHTMLQRLGVDWTGLGFGPGDMDELVEVLLRFLQSFAAYPGPDRSEADLRAFLRRWVGSAVTARTSDVAAPTA